jgi:hypothetical protein
MASDDAVRNARLRRGSWFYEVGFGARSVAGSMTAVSLTRSEREHGFQMHHYRDCAGDPLMSWRVEPLSLLIFLCGGVTIQRL